MNEKYLYISTMQLSTLLAGKVLKWDSLLRQKISLPAKTSVHAGFERDSFDGSRARLCVSYSSARSSVGDLHTDLQSWSTHESAQDSKVFSHMTK